MRHALVLLALVATTQCALADDFGPRGDVHEVRFVAQRLLAHWARHVNADPKDTKITDVVVVKDASLLSWDVGSGHGMMGLIRTLGRWWDAFDIDKTGGCWSGGATSYPLQGNRRIVVPLGPTLALLSEAGLPAALVAQARHNADVRAANSLRAAPGSNSTSASRFVPSCDVATYDIPNLQIIKPEGAELSGFHWDTSGYEIAVHYAANNSVDGVFHIPYARPPTQAEIIPYPTTYQFQTTAVVYFHLEIDGSVPVTFKPGTTVDIWFPFVLDDTLKYDLTIGFAGEPIGPIYAKPYDNVLHYTLPGFSATPGRTLMGEIDGNWP